MKCCVTGPTLAVARSVITMFMNFVTRRVNQMQVGNLVMLSAYGEKRGFNSKLKRSSNGLGIVIDVTTSVNVSYPFQVRWFGRESFLDRHNRRELKHARR